MTVAHGSCLGSIRATDAQRLLKATNWRVNAALDAFFNDPRPASSKASAANSAQVTKNLETLWTKYCGERACPLFLYSPPPHRVLPSRGC